MATLPEPRVDLESQFFYGAAEEGRFLIRRCTDCGEAHWYPRARCPFCSGPTEWVAASGEGSVYSYSVMQKADAPAHVLAYVTLAEGPRMLTNIVGTASADIHIGQAVTLSWEAAGTRKVPCFTAKAP